MEINDSRGAKEPALAREWRIGGEAVGTAENDQEANEDCFESGEFHYVSVLLRLPFLSLYSIGMSGSCKSCTVPLLLVVLVLTFVSGRPNSPDASGWRNW